MSTTEVHCELVLFELNGRLPCNLVEMPTVCLLAADVIDPSMELALMVDCLVLAGCRYFMTWGDAAETLHDALDDVLEERGGDCLSVVTAAHTGEPAEDVAWMMVNATLLGECRIRCCVGYDNALAGVDELLDAVRSAVP